jgi:hypothetical protein
MPLPHVPRFVEDLTLDDDFPLMGNFVGSAGTAPLPSAAGPSNQESTLARYTVEGDIYYNPNSDIIHFGGETFLGTLFSFLKCNEKRAVGRIAVSLGESPARRTSWNP